MKQLISLSLALVLGCIGLQAQLHITTNTTWSADQILTQSVIVDPGVTLTINAGVRVTPIYTDQNGDNIGDIFIEVNGLLNLNGDVCDRVVFEPFEVTANRNYWQGLRINSDSNNGALRNFNLSFAAQGLQLFTNATVDNAFVFECPTGITVQSNALVTIENSWVHTNTGTGITNIGGTLTLNNSHLTNNGKFGVANHAGNLIMGFCTIDENTWGGIFIGGLGNNDIQNSTITNNQGSGFEISEWTSANDFASAASNSGIPTILVNTCNILGNASTSHDIVLESNEAFLNIPDWGACQALIQPNVGQSQTWELPLGHIASQTVTCARYCAGTQSSWNRTYSLRNAYLGQAVATTTQSTYNPCNCGFVVNLGNRYHAGERTFAGDYTPTDRYHWYIGANSTSDHGIWDAVTTVRLGGYEVYSSVGNSTTFNFTGNYWGTFLNVDALVFDVNNLNTNYAGFATSAFNFAYANVDDGLPNIDLGANTNICEGSPLVLDAGNEGSSFVWSPGGFTTQTLEVSEAGTYSVTVSNDCGSNNAEITILDVDPLPLTPATPVGQTLLCPNSPNTNYTVSQAQFATSYQWHISPANAGTVSGTGTTGIVNWDNNYVGNATVWVNAINACGSSSNSQTLAVSIINAPSTPAVPTGESAFCTAPEVSTYTTPGLPLADTYSWAITPANAGVISGNGTSAQVTWDDAFMGYAYITVSGNGYCGQGGTSQALEVGIGFYDASITGNTSACTGETVTLTANAADDYLWTTGATTQSIQVEVSANTTIGLTIFDDDGCVAETAVNITELALPQVSLGGDEAICFGETATLQASGGTSYAWSNGTSGASINVSPLSTTTYSVVVTSANGCSNSADIQVVVEQIPNVAINGLSVVCAGAPLSLAASGAISYQWQNGPNTSTWLVNPLVNTTYSVTGFTPAGCTANAAFEVAVTPAPTATISGDNFICPGESVVLTASGGTVIAWSTGSNAENITVSPSSTTTYTVNVSNNEGCIDDAAFEVMVSDFTGGSISGPQAICAGESITLIAAGASSYVWSTGAISAVLNTTPTETTQYSVAMTDAQGCTANVDWLVTVNPPPAVPTIVLFGGELLSSAPSGNQWYYAGVPLPNQTNQNFVPIQNGEYTVVVTNANGCSASSLPYSYNGVGIDEAAARMFKVYPNPFEHQIIMDNLTGTAVERVQLFNAMGSLVWEEQTTNPNSSHITLDVRSVVSGYYFMVVSTAEGSFTFKIMKGGGY